MMAAKNIHFIINPSAGKGKSPLTPEFLEQFFVRSLTQVTVKYSNYKKHAIELTKESIAQGADILVACGGDGTINEVASSLVGTSIPLGIVPIGSGNGLASNLGISKNLRKALTLLRNPHTTQIDVGCINGKYFFSNTGLGFDAKVIKNYESSHRRTLLGYLQACAMSFKKHDSIRNIAIKINDQDIRTDIFMVFVSNSNEMGYKLSLTPKASLQDGFLDALVISKIGRLKMLWLGILLLMNRPYLLKEAKSFRAQKIELFKDGKEILDSQVDGELFSVGNRHISIGVMAHALNVIAPPDFQ
ncbi:MAG: diacylglycerol kinase family lipid kinase [Allomuricauda sp.]